MCSLGGSLNLEFDNTKIIAKQARVQEDSHTFSVHVKSHDAMYIIVNLEGITDFGSSGVISYKTDPSLTNIPYCGLKIKKKIIERLKCYVLVNKIGCLMLLIFIETQVTSTC